MRWAIPYCYFRTVSALQNNEPQETQGWGPAEVSWRDRGKVYLFLSIHLKPNLLPHPSCFLILCASCPSGFLVHKQLCQLVSWWVYNVGQEGLYFWSWDIFEQTLQTHSQSLPPLQRISTTTKKRFLEILYQYTVPNTAPVCSPWAQSQLLVHN